MIPWLCTLPLLNRIYKQGGIDSFIHARADILAMFQGDVEGRATELSKERLDALLTVIDDRMIISFSEKEKAVYIGGKRVTDPGIMQNLKAEAEALAQFDIWKILSETPKRLAQKALFEDDGNSEIVHTKGRSMLYLLDTQEKILATIKSYGK